MNLTNIDTLPNETALGIHIIHTRFSIGYDNYVQIYMSGVYKCSVKQKGLKEVYRVKKNGAKIERRGKTMRMRKEKNNRSKLQDP